MDMQFARNFADEWVAAWNAHDLDRVLSHYRDDFVLATPLIKKIAGEPSGVLTGKAAIRPYWSRALKLVPDLRLKLLHVTSGIDMVAVCYETVGNRIAIENFLFDSNGKVCRSTVCYNS